MLKGLSKWPTYGWLSSGVWGAVWGYLVDSLRQPSIQVRHLVGISQGLIQGGLKVAKALRFRLKVVIR